MSTFVPPADLYDALTAWSDAHAAIDRHAAAIREHAAEVQRHADAVRDLERRAIPVMRDAGARIFRARGSMFGLIDGRITRLDESLASDYPIPPDPTPAPIGPDGCNCDRCTTPPVHPDEWLDRSNDELAAAAREFFPDSIAGDCACERCTTPEFTGPVS